MKTIKDSVHDHIEVSGVARDLLDTPAMQRLRRISQLGTVSLVYPSANHTRFEHSLGVYHLATRALDNLEADEHDRRRVEAAALLHDVGHSPHSHNTEGVLHRHTGKYHDEVHDLVDDGPVGEVLRANDLDPADIAGLVEGEGRYGAIVSGELDVDRMDYLVRDAHHTGVPYGTIDHERLVRELTFVDGQLVLGEGNVETAESLLVARALMTPAVYAHPAARISKSMLRRAVERLIDAGADPEAIRRWDDYRLRTALRDGPDTEETARRLDTRDLLKQAVRAEYDDTPDWLLEADYDELRDVERRIAERIDVAPELVIVDVPSEPSMVESSTRVVVGGDIRRLDRQSPLVAALEQANKSQWRMGVYAPRGTTEAAGEAAAAELGLDIDGPLISEVSGGLPPNLDVDG
ncbi:phosphohydrolase [Halobacteriales archaeon SW_7_68_16]|nr:MAG: phosphohydrolase [Halobacteriales archaeon SW_7_68_16]